jgi:hypothetical protein
MSGQNIQAGSRVRYAPRPEWTGTVVRSHAWGAGWIVLWDDPRGERKSNPCQAADCNLELIPDGEALINIQPVRVEERG